MRHPLNRKKHPQRAFLPWPRRWIAATIFAILLGVADPAGAALFGITATDVSGDTDFVEIDPGTGQSTPLFTLNVGAGNAIGGMTYHSPTGSFIANFITASGPEIGILDTTAQQFTPVTVTGLTGSAQTLSGITYDSVGDRLLVSYADDGTNNERRLAEVALDGTVLNTTPAFTDDIDALQYRATDGTLVGFDPNAVSTQRIFRIDGLFTPTVATIGTPPSRDDVGDVAIDPVTGATYINGFDTTGGFLSRIDGDSAYVDLGPYNSVTQMKGIAFGAATSTSVESASSTAPPVLRLFAAPNPFGPTTTLRYNHPAPSHVNITVYDLAGRRVLNLVDRWMGAGRQEIAWNGTDARGRSLPSGRYFVRIRTGRFSETVPVTLMR